MSVKERQTNTLNKPDKRRPSVKEALSGLTEQVTGLAKGKQLHGWLSCEEGGIRTNFRHPASLLARGWGAGDCSGSTKYTVLPHCIEKNRQAKAKNLQSKFSSHQHGALSFNLHKSVLLKATVNGKWPKKEHKLKPRQSPVNLFRSTCVPLGAVLYITNSSEYANLGNVHTHTHTHTRRYKESISDWI